MLARLYHFILDRPKLVLVIAILAFSVLGYQATKLEVDASSETLLLEDDKDLEMTRLVNERYKSQDFLFITYSPKDDLLAETTLAQIRQLKAELLAVPGVDSVTTILDVPLLESPPKPVKELLKSVPTVESPGVDKALAKQELLNSPIYRNLIVSPDFKTTALQVNLVEDAKFLELVRKRNQLKQKQKSEGLNAEEEKQLHQTITEFKQHRDQARAAQHTMIATIRSIMDQHRDEGEIFLGGGAMIADDLISFIKGDLLLFGGGVILMMIVTLWILFRQMRWVVLPLISCALSVVATAGFLGMFNWEVTVISSNFISLQLIITMSLNIHLIVRYRELVSLHPEWHDREIILDTLLSKGAPSLFAVLTTVAGFSSLILSGILPVINFGWMMSAGVSVSLIITFVLFPLLMSFLPRLEANNSFEQNFPLITMTARTTEHHGKVILGIGILLLGMSIWGSTRLVVENSFIDYFKESTEIFQGMKMIDQNLGGTTPLDVVIEFPQSKAGSIEDEVPTDEPSAKDEFSDFEEEFENQGDQAQYWFTADKMAVVEKVHDYLNSLPETGKVMSLGTMLKVGNTINDGKPLDSFMLALVYNELPEKFKSIILSPYVSVEHNQVRFNIRIRDSEPDLRRDALLKQIRYDLEHKLGLSPEQFHVTGLLVLYNNMLQSLYNSQILTLGAVILILLVMFLVLFRSWYISTLAIIPNVLSVFAVLGFMGWANIPLDMMTITIASISVGMAVDNTIHYIHRFQTEFAQDPNYVRCMYRCHSSTGYAMYNTSLIIIIGFSILTLSNFIPSIYFGLLTGLAMFIALLGALMLLPQLILMFKPFGKESAGEKP